MWKTKQICIAVLVTFLSPLIVRYLIVNSPASGESRYQILHDNPLSWFSNRVDAPVVANPENTQVIAVPEAPSSSLGSGNSSLEGLHWLDTWNHMKHLANISTGLPHATEAINDARTCGLVAGSSVTVIGTPGSLSGNFWIDLVGAALPGEPQKPIVLHYNVRLTGDTLTEGPVIVQNAFTASNGWGFEDRCPCSNSSNATQGT